MNKTKVQNSKVFEKCENEHFEDRMYYYCQLKKGHKGKHKVICRVIWD